MTSIDPTSGHATMDDSRPRRRRLIAASLAALAAFAAVGASAASLGGLRNDDLGADNGIVASCDTNGMDAQLVQRYHRPSGGYRVQRVVLRFVSADCAGLPYQLQLFSSEGTSYEVSGDSLVVRNVRDRQPGPGVDRAGVVSLVLRAPAADVNGLALVIGGSGTP